MIAPQNGLLDREEEVVTAAVVAALHALMEIASTSDTDVELRMEAATRILMYSSSLSWPTNENTPESEEATDGDANEPTGEEG